MSLSPGQQVAAMLTAFADGVETAMREVAGRAFEAEGVPADHALFAVDRTLEHGFTVFDVVAQAPILGAAWARTVAALEGVDDGD